MTYDGASEEISGVVKWVPVSPHDGCGNPAGVIIVASRAALCLATALLPLFGCGVVPSIANHYPWYGMPRPSVRSAARDHGLEDVIAGRRAAAFSWFRA